MSLVIIFGPQAVGKMTVGHELEKITGLKLFHNHLTIELVSPFISYGTPKGRELVRLFRNKILEAVAESDQPGIIFTMVWEFEHESDSEYIAQLTDLFSKNGRKTYLVELEADFETRLERNRTEHRLAHKVSKRDLVLSDDLLKKGEMSRSNSFEGEITHPYYLRINNTALTPEATAHIIKEHFTL